jgi:transposase
MRYELTDHEWTAIKPMLPSTLRCSGARVSEPKAFRPRRSRLVVAELAPPQGNGRYPDGRMRGSRATGPARAAHATSSPKPRQRPRLAQQMPARDRLAGER